MAKLSYTTKPPKKGYVNYESNSTHKDSAWPNKWPDRETQSQALKIVNDDLPLLLDKLKKLGYDTTKVNFNITFNND